MAYKIDVVEDLALIGEQPWDDLVKVSGGSVFHSFRWLQAFKQGMPYRLDPYHIVARDGDRLVGIMPAYLTQGCPRLEAHRKYVLTKATYLREPMLLAHTLYSYYGGPLVRQADWELIRQLLIVFDDLARQLRVDVYGVVNVPEEQAMLRFLLAEMGYHVRYLSSTMHMSCAWTTFDEYLAQLKSKRRVFMRGIVRRAKAQGVTAQLTPKPQNLGTLVALSNNVLKEHRHRNTDLFPRTYWETLLEVMGDRLKFLLVRAPDGRVICFFAVLDAFETLTPWIAGIDYTTLKVYEPYHFAYVWLIKYAIEHKYHAVDMGRGSYRFKSRYGFQRRMLYLALKTPFPIMDVEVDRWSLDLSTYALARFAQHFAGSSGAS
ncbi:MAG: hypothetical protein C7B47_14765 [Sulfobacillus thermosulfidooxidans]|uniref:BioF2-like acetyltransferase domain-containing protein n=1 Tax=Sulfobacillus thermosulfidooxidans TaxID=28034 RepID=A0A2T2WQF8_SULTH|nr:MAG: hypothetical protein C7B47_14765 [Sulfobacillus thermosulfidooxidans]